MVTVIVYAIPIAAGLYCAAIWAAAVYVALAGEPD